ncbi:hypothetical protein [Sphingomonas phyllosphaerae]|uniref:hypothetical protein n=1 Tax=Sphingomonas phyllosphaerae TaxID=257003 RepID=UPI0024135166|nr:hypothetical protein [Sphingomonas phyllosphaerae]
MALADASIRILPHHRKCASSAARRRGALRLRRNHRTIGVGRNLDATEIRPDERRDLGLSVARRCAYGITRSQSRALPANDNTGAGGADVTRPRISDDGRKADAK